MGLNFISVLQLLLLLLPLLPLLTVLVLVLSWTILYVLWGPSESYFLTFSVPLSNLRGHRGHRSIRPGTVTINRCILHRRRRRLT